MAVITAAVTINGQPLKRAYVEHTGAFGVGSLGIYMTDRNGSFTIDAGLLFNQVDVRIHCQNSVIRVVDGGLANIGISYSGVVTNGAILNITNNVDHFQILNNCLDVYDTVWRQFRPYRNSTRLDFPLGKQPSLRSTFSSNTRIELTYPDISPIPLAYVEPSGLTNAGFPLAHIKNRNDDGRLFGEGDAASPVHDASLLAHELGHVFHFSALTPNTRIQVEALYLAWIVGQIPNGNFFHGVNMQTSQIVAFTEAAGIFSERFFAYARLVRPNLSGDALLNDFVRNELSANPSLPGVLVDAYVPIATRTNNIITPLVMTGDRVEGSVYGAIYLDFANRVGLLRAVRFVLASNATNFDNFRLYVIGLNNPVFTAAINAVRDTWNM